MKTLILIILTHLIGILPAPEITPQETPFEWDRTLCPSSPFDYAIAEPNLSIAYDFDVVNEWGADITDVELVLDANNLTIVWQCITKDQITEGWRQHLQIMWTAESQEGVYYYEIRVLDEMGRQDARTLVVLVMHDDPPFIYPHDDPVITKSAQQLVQRAKKLGMTTTKHAKVY